MVRPWVSKLIVTSKGSWVDLAHAFYGGFDLVQVAHRLDQDGIHAAFSQTGSLLGEGFYGFR